jgi:putative polyhydroxyalkanoate system protein
MSDILVRRGHGLTPKRARGAADQIAAELRVEYALTFEWDGDTLHFNRSGVSGHLVLLRREIEIRVRLGFLLLPLRGTIEREIQARCEQHFPHGGKHA